eukprot:SAG11_NODE_62_length_19006_cov_6.513143_7_plen_61_part_00
MKILIWVYNEQIEDLIKGEPVEYFEKEPGIFENVVQVMVDTDTYQKLKDNKLDDRPNPSK